MMQWGVTVWEWAMSGAFPFMAAELAYILVVQYSAIPRRVTQRLHCQMRSVPYVTLRLVSHLSQVLAVTT
jgi:hypothetical protein